MPTFDWVDLLELLIPTQQTTPDVNTTFQVLGGQSGPAFWNSYDGLSSHQQGLAQTELWLDSFFCGWWPGDRTTTPETATPGPPTITTPPTITDVVVVPPPYYPLIPYVPVQTPVVPELSTWLMLMLGAAAIAMIYRHKVR